MAGSPRLDRGAFYVLLAEVLQERSGWLTMRGDSISVEGLLKKPRQRFRGSMSVMAGTHRWNHVDIIHQPRPEEPAKWSKDSHKRDRARGPLRLSRASDGRAKSCSLCSLLEDESESRSCDAIRFIALLHEFRLAPATPVPYPHDSVIARDKPRWANRPPRVFFPTIEVRSLYGAAI